MRLIINLLLLFTTSIITDFRGGGGGGGRWEEWGREGGVEERERDEKMSFSPSLLLQTLEVPPALVQSDFFGCHESR